MASARMPLDWIGSDGGPNVVLHAATAHEWGGSADEFGEDLESWGDYGLACGVEGLHGIIEFGTGTAHRALVLGGEPLDSAFLAEHRCIVRWDHADSESQLLDVVDARLPVARWESAVDWEIPSGGLVMIDAAYRAGDYALGGLAERSPVRIDLPPGRYRVEAAEVAGAEGLAAAVLHRFFCLE